MLLIGLRKLADAIFRIIQKRFILHHQTWSDNT